MEPEGGSADDEAEADRPEPVETAAREEAVEFEAVDFESWPESEVDLSTAVDKLTPPAAADAIASEPEEPEAPEPVPAQAAVEPPPSTARSRAAFDSTLPAGDHAARNFRVGQTYAAANMVKEAAEAFEQAARDPRYRFRSAQALARLFRKQQMLKEALEWLDIAAEAPAPSVDEHRTALYEWADALEATGETTRALVVLLDLVAEQGDYKDARARIDRLSRVQA